jgi:hypothetical protein
VLHLRKLATISSSELDTIPLLGSISQCISSTTVVVDKNQLKGPIPIELGLLMNLKVLHLRKFATISSSELDTIPLLGSVSQCISSTVVVEGNQLKGPILTELGRLTGLDELYLSKFATLSSLELDTTPLLGSVSQFISSTVFVVANQLTGPIPSELGRLTNLQSFYLCKFATVSSLELDTVTLLAFGLQLFISSTVS